MKRVPLACAALDAWVLAVVLGAGPARASDGAYGRLDGDASWQVDLGGGAADGEPGAFGMATFRYLQTAGLYGTWMWHPDDKADARWSSSFGVELRPLFLPRFLKNMEAGPAALDLMIDSLSLRLGAVTADRGAFGRHGLGFETGAGFGVPLSASAAGPWISASGSLRFSHLDMGGSASDPDRAFVWTVTLGWQEIFALGIVDAGDTAP